MERYENIDGFQYDHALSKWAITKDGELLSSAQYADYIKPERNMPKGILKGERVSAGIMLNGDTVPTWWSCR